MLQQIARMLIFLGLAITAFGVLLYLFGRMGLGRLPGDISIAGRNWRVYLPLGTCILLSVLLTLILYVARLLRR